jgi:histidine triad (HIT) family protein
MTTIFHKIVAGEVPADSVYEDERVLVIKDIHPKAPVHLLVIPKKKDIPSIKDVTDSDAELLGHMMVIAKKVAEQEGLKGYKLIFNVGKEGGQEIEYLHLHLLGGWKQEMDPDKVRA